MSELAPSEGVPPPDGDSTQGPGLSPTALAVADWLRDLSRTAKTVRLYQASNPVLEDARTQFARTSSDTIERFGGWTVRITPEEILLGEETIVHPPRGGPSRGEAAQRLLLELPFRLYRDGVREIGILPGISRRDLDALVDALALAWTERDRADDIVTSLWQANPTHIRIEAAPAEQPLFIATGTGAPEKVERGLALGLGLPPLATDIRAVLGDRGGAVGLHRESGREEAPPVVYLSVIQAYGMLRPDADAARQRFLHAWQKESTADWHDEAAGVLDRVLAADPHAETANALCRFLVSGVARAIDGGGWREATGFLQQLGRLDPAGTASAELLGDAIGNRSELELGETLDGAAPGEIEEFFALLLALGPSGVSLALAALRGARERRTHAASCAALAFLCADAPQLLEPTLRHGSPEIVLHAVSVLGHIGGHEAASLTALVARDPNAEVTREVARTAPAFPDPERTSILLDLLENPDDATVLAALRSARRERNPAVAQRILEHVQRPEFDERAEEVRRTMFQALVDIGDASIVPALEQLLTQGGWLARASWRRTAAGQTLSRMGIPEASAAIARGRAHRSEAVRAASGDSGSRRAA